MNNITIVSFYTTEPHYRKMARKLENSCKKFNIPSIIKERKSSGSWVQNCAQKPLFILEQTSSIPKNEYIIWLDSDSEIIEKPTIFYEMEESFAIRAEPGSSRKKPAGRDYIDLPEKWPKNLSPMWFNSGTIVFKNNLKNKKFLQYWAELNKGNNKWDQWTLQEAWCEHLPETLWLPRSYCQIERIHGNKDAVILHALASVEQKVQRV